jgi:hypothetical protein
VKDQIGDGPYEVTSNDVEEGSRIALVSPFSPHTQPKTDCQPLPSRQVRNLRVFVYLDELADMAETKRERSTFGGRFRSRSASASPIAAECLNPWPEQGEAKITRSCSGCLSITKRAPGAFA